MLKFRYDADKLPVLAVTTLFALDLLVWATVDSWPLLLVWFGLGIIPKGGIAAYNHHHQHLNTFHDTLSNRLIEFIYGVQTGIISHGWVLHHSVGHHVTYLDQRKDESRWRRSDGGIMGELEYTLVGGVAAYPRAWEVGKRFPKYRAALVQMAVVTVVLLGAGLAVRPLQTVTVFIAPMVLGLFLTVWATYTHHTGKKTDNHYVACNNIIHRGYNLLTGNLGYHTAHHSKPGVHWSKLPELHAQIAHLIPADCYLSPGLPWRFGQRVVGPPPGMPFAAGKTTAPDAGVIVPYGRGFGAEQQLEA